MPPKLLTYLTLADRSSNFSEDITSKTMMKVFGNHISIYNEVARIYKLTAKEAADEIRNMKTVSDYEDAFKRELMDGLTVQ